MKKENKYFKKTERKSGQETNKGRNKINTQKCILYGQKGASHLK